MSIIGIQMLITAVFCLFAVFSSGYVQWQRDNLWLIYICLILNIVALISLVCFRSVCKKVPQNYILLFTFTAGESYIISFACGQTKPEIVLQAVGLTSLLVFSLVIYAIKTRKDITLKITFFIYAPIALLALIIVAALFQSELLSMFISLLIIAVFSAYLVFDVQRLQGNKKFKYDLDDYIIAALDIYMDIVIIFLEILKLFSKD